MAITYSWKVTSIRKANIDETLENVIVHVRWEKKGVDEAGNDGTFVGATPLSNPDPTNFIAYEDLTEAIVLDWIKGVVVGSYEEHVNGQIQKQIDAKKNPVEEINDGSLPWNPPGSTPSVPTPAV